MFKIKLLKRNKFHTFVKCSYWWLWTGKCLLGTSFLILPFISIYFPHFCSKCYGLLKWETRKNNLMDYSKNKLECAITSKALRFYLVPFSGVSFQVLCSQPQFDQKMLFHPNVPFLYCWKRQKNIFWHFLEV